MRKIRRPGVPRAVLDHLRLRMMEREISPDQLGEFARRFDTEPTLPVGRWFKRLPGMIVCGEGDLAKTFLRRGQVAEGEEIA